MSSTLAARSGTPSTLRALRFTWLRLQSRADTASLAEPLEAARLRLRAAADAEAELEERSAAFTAEIAYLDSLEDAEVSSLARELRVLIGGNLKDPRWTKLFSTAPSELVKPVGGPVVSLHIHHILRTMAIDGDYASLGARRDALDAAREAVEAAETARSSLGGPLMAAQLERRQALEAAHRVYNRVKPQLQLLFDSPALIRSFFPPAAAAAAEEGETDKA